MDCSLIQGHLIGYHFATVSDEERAAVEAHLVACSACVRTYLAIKTHVDTSARASEGPSEQARLSLRKAVEARFRPTLGHRVRRWLTRPVPMYQGLAVTSIVVAAAIAAPTLVHLHAPRHDDDRLHAERIDTARTTAHSRSIY